MALTSPKSDTNMKKQNKNYCTFYIVRHGETEWNVQHRIQGQEDSPLTPLGIKQAKKTKALLSKIQFDLAFSSDSLRAKRTAEIIAKEHNLAIQATKKIRERGFGKYEGMKLKKLKAMFADLFEAWDKQGKNAFDRIDSIETTDKIIARLFTFLRQIAIGHPGKNILVATHGGTMRILLLRLGFIESKQSKHLFIHNASYIKLSSDGVDFFIKDTYGIEINPSRQHGE